MKLSDAKFVRESIARHRAAPAPMQRTAAEKTASLEELVAVTGRRGRLAALGLDKAVGLSGLSRVAYVSSSGTREYGWLESQSEDGHTARIVVDDLSRVEVPMTRVSRLGEESEVVESVLPAFVRKRADLRVSSTPAAINASGDWRVRLSYNASLGLPPEEEVLDLVKVVASESVPAEVETRVVAVDQVTPGHLVAVFNRSAAKPKTPKDIAEMLTVDDVFRRADKIIMKVSWKPADMEDVIDVKNAVTDFVKVVINHRHREFGLVGRVKVDVDEKRGKAIALITSWSDSIQPEVRTVESR